jgi:Tfp pilus assembly protein PilF
VKRIGVPLRSGVADDVDRIAVRPVCRKHLVELRDRFRIELREDAIGILKMLEDTGIAPAGVMQNLATCYFGLQRYESARAYGERLLAAGEKSGDVLHLTVTSLHHLGDVDAAVKLADEYVAVAGTHGRFAGACALLFLDGNDAAKAAKFAAVALSQNPDSIDGLLVQATLAASELENEQAFKQYSRILQLSPQNGRAWLGLGMLATLAQDFARACELLAHATEQMPQHIGSWHALAWAHLFGGDAAGAEKHFAHALELDRNFGESHGAMAAMLAMRGEREAAEREIEIAERLDRKNMSSQFARAVLLERASGPEASKQFVRDAVRLMARQLSGRPAAVLNDLASRKPRGS